MRIEHGDLSGDILVTDELALHGQLAGNATVDAGGYLVLHGMIEQDLVLQPGGRAVLHGMVCGDVYNHGGDLHVLGAIQGTLHREAGRTSVDPSASVNKASRRRAATRPMKQRTHRRIVKRCPRCQNRNPQIARFCARCGQPLETAQ